ncbi:MAG: hypothetical protein FJ026_18655 [Chloroflexi bacterium]|nr:hypothetical protein [Chloroflexota bacterium]
MRNRGLLYVGILLMAFGVVFLLAHTVYGLLVPDAPGLGWVVMWPFLVLLVGLAFWLPLLIWWDRRQKLAGLAIPGAIVTTNGLILLYQNLTWDWRSWSYLWTMEPIAVAAGLLAIHLLSNQARGVLVAAGILGGIGLFFFLIFSSAFGGLPGLVAPAALILAGILIAISGLRRRAEQGESE